MRRAALLTVAVLVVLLAIPSQDADALSEMRLSDGAVYEYETFGSAYPGYHSEIVSVTTDGEGLFISSALEGYEVTAVREHAVSGQNVRCIVVPATIRTLGEGVFDGCPSLERVYFMGDRPAMPSMPEGVEVLAMPNASGWDGASGITTVAADAADGSSVLYAIIEGEAVAVSCTPSSDGSVTVDASAGGYPVASIGPSAFAGEHDVGRTDIRSVTVAEGVSILRERAFFYCYGLESVSLPSTLTVVMDEAFRASASLRDVEIPDGVGFIGFEAFRDCSSLRSIAIPDSVASLGEGAFYICSSAESLVIGSGVTSIPARAFGYSSSLISVDIRGDVVSVGDTAFYMCSSLRSFDLPDMVASLGRGAFYECSSLGSIGLGESLRSIGSACFQGCSSLRSATIPSTVVSVGDKAFAYCTSLNDVLFLGDMPSFGTGVFLNDDVSIHCTEAHSDSWSGYEGIVVDGEDDKGLPWAAVVIAALVASILVIVFAVLRRRPVRWSVRTL